MRKRWLVLIFVLFFLTGCTKLTYEVKFDVNGGISIASLIVEEKTMIELPDAVKEGHSFLGWYDSLDENAQEIKDPYEVNQSITLYAKWEVNQYSIDFDSMDGSPIISITQDYNTELNMPLKPEREGYTFIGWYTDNSFIHLFNLQKMPAENIFLYAKWEINQYTIDFDSQGGSEIESITQDYNTLVTKPQDPYRKGYSFEGWYKLDNPNSLYEFTTLPAENILLNAKWVPNVYDVNFIYNSNQENQTISAYADSELEFPLYENHLFTNWYIDEDLTIVYDSNRPDFCKNTHDYLL